MFFGVDYSNLLSHEGVPLNNEVVIYKMVTQIIKLLNDIQ